MDYDKLIERLKSAAGGPEGIKMCQDAATALSTLQAENKRLNKIVCSIPTTPDSGRTVSQYDKEMSMCAYLDDLEAENEKLRAELEKVKRCIEIVENQRDQMKRERDAAIDCIYKIEDALDRGNDNDWAREHISEWESQKED